MKKSLQVLLAMIALLATVTTADAQQAADPRVADLVRAGKLRVALSHPLYTKAPVTGELRGVGINAAAIEIVRTLAARLGVELLLLGYPTFPEVAECLKADTCDVAIWLWGFEPPGAAEVDISTPFVQVDYTYLVPAGSSIRSVADADRPAIRIAVVRNHASTLTLSRILKQAKMVYPKDPTLDLLRTFELLRTGHADAMASERSLLLNFSTGLPGSRVLEDRYGVRPMAAMAVPKGQGGWLAYISEFIEEAKASGLVQRAIERAGLRGIQVAPPENPNAQK